MEPAIAGCRPTGASRTAIIAVVSASLGTTCGAVAAYLLDPTRGRRRRHVLRDRTVRQMHVVARRGMGHLKVVRNQLHGVVASVQSYFDFALLVPDDVVEARVRAKMGHVLHHPYRPEVSVSDGTVTLKGKVPAESTNRALACIESVPGVLHVIDLLDRQDPAPVAGKPTANTADNHTNRGTNRGANRGRRGDQQRVRHGLR